MLCLISPLNAGHAVYYLLKSRSLSLQIHLNCEVVLTNHFDLFPPPSILLSGAFSRPGPPGPGSAGPCPDWTTRHGPRGTLAQLGPESDQARSAPPFHTPVVPRLL